MLLGLKPIEAIQISGQICILESMSLLGAKIRPQTRLSRKYIL